MSGPNTQKSVLDATEPIREPWPIFHRLKLALGIRIVVGGVVLPQLKSEESVNEKRRVVEEVFGARP